MGGREGEGERREKERGRGRGKERERGGKGKGREGRRKGGKGRGKGRKGERKDPPLLFRQIEPCLLSITLSIQRPFTIHSLVVDICTLIFNPSYMLSQ